MGRTLVVTLALILMLTAPCPGLGSPPDAGQQVDLGIITVRTLAQARKIRSLLLKGKSFEELARKYSVGPAAARGGRLGLVSVAKLREEYREAIKDLAPGRPSQPVPTEEGYSILMIFTAPTPSAGPQRIEAPAQLVARRKVMAALEAMARGAWTEADGLLRQATARNPHEATARFLSPLVARARSTPALARGLRHVAKGLMALMDGHTNEAVTHLKKAVAAAPGECAFKLLLAQALGAGGKETKARRLLKALSPTSPCGPRAMTLLGIMELNAGRIKQAERLLSKATKADPSLAQAPYYLGLIAGARGERARAIYLLKRALEADPYMEEACNELGVLYMHEGKLALAARWLRRALALRPDYPEAQVNLGNCYARMGNYRKAIEEYEKALALRPGMPQALVNLAAAYSELKQWDKATRYAKQALAQGFRLPPALARRLAPYMSNQP